MMLLIEQPSTKPASIEMDCIAKEALVILIDRWFGPTIRTTHDNGEQE